MLSSTVAPMPVAAVSAKPLTARQRDILTALAMSEPLTPRELADLTFNGRGPAPGTFYRRIYADLRPLERWGLVTREPIPIHLRFDERVRSRLRLTEAGWREYHTA